MIDLVTNIAFTVIGITHAVLLYMAIATAVIMYKGSRH